MPLSISSHWLVHCSLSTVLYGSCCLACCGSLVRAHASQPISAGGGSNKAQKAVVNKKAKSKANDDSDDEDTLAQKAKMKADKDKVKAMQDKLKAKK
ncbi:MAG: hypothetical protein SGPRY_008019 [Prymnesium sp.]